MELPGSKTERNLNAALAREAQARNRYLFSGDLAREAGLHHIADVFYEMAANEGEHAQKEFEFLGGLGDVRSAIEKAAQGERLECRNIYPAFAREARKEGFTRIAEFFERMSHAEGVHEERLRALLKDLDGVEAFRGKTVLRSATTVAQVTLPDMANPAGFVHGGELVKMIDNAAGVAAARHSQKNIVLARVAEIQFLHPVRVGSFVLIDARLTFTARSTMEVTVNLDAESPRSGKRRRAVTAVLIMVALDEKGRPAEVPPLLISTEEQQRLYEQGKNRYEAYKKSKERA